MMSSERKAKVNNFLGTCTDLVVLGVINPVKKCLNATIYKCFWITIGRKGSFTTSVHHKCTSTGLFTNFFFFLFQFDKKEKLSYKRTNTTHKYFKVSGTNNRVKTPITVAHYKI